jgi:2-haloacid dehalogenase
VKGKPVTIGIGIDVYGTLIDPLEMSVHLRPLVGDSAHQVAELWRTKQLEYTFRRASMGKYENFDVCSRQALVFALESLRIGLSASDQETLLEEYQHLHTYPDAVPGLRKLKDAGNDLMAFSNGVEVTLRDLLRHTGILPHLNGIVSVDDLKTFKPDPRVYFYLAQRLGRSIDNTWLVSSNPFDVIGAKAAGLKGAWIKRTSQSAFDPWGIHPDVIAQDLIDFAERLGNWL